MKRSNPSLPKLAERFIGYLYIQDDYLERSGDLEEAFADMNEDSSPLWSKIWLWAQILKLCLGVFRKNTVWRLFMFTNYLKIALRNLRKHKGISSLNITGLSVGMAVFILIFLYVQFELSYDRYHAHAGRIHRVCQEIDYLTVRTAYTSQPLASVLKQEYPEIQSAVRFDRIERALVYANEVVCFEKNFLLADPDIFEIFSFPIIKGYKNTVLTDPFSVVISESSSQKYFGQEDPLGNTLKCKIDGQDAELMITGIFQDIPANTHFTADFIVPFEIRRTWGAYMGWGDNGYYTYVLLKEGTDPKVLESKIAATDLQKYSEGYDLHDYFLQPVTDIHLRSRLSHEFPGNSDIKTVVLFSLIAVLALVIACINAVNLATARASFRTKEVGMRKIIGAQKSQLIQQFIGESLLLTLFSFLMAVILIIAVLPLFRNFVERAVAFDPLNNPLLLAILLSVLFLTGLLSGVYPAFLLSSLKPLSLFRGETRSRRKNFSMRNILVTLQFSASIALIICTFITRKQLLYLQKMDMGYNRDQVVVLPILDSQFQDRLGSLRSELLKNPRVLGISASSNLLNNITARFDVQKPVRQDDSRLGIYTVDADYGFIDLFGLKILEGRNFSREFPSDQSGAFLINEEAVKALGWDNPVGNELSLSVGRTGPVIGVFNNHVQTIYQPVKPTAIFLMDRIQYLSIKIRPDNIPGTIAGIEKTWKRLVPEHPFEYSFFDDIFDRTYKADQKVSRLFGTFAAITIFVACLGLFGLAAFSAQRRVKEIGIRKVLGASVSEILFLLGQEFTKWVLLANFLAWPVAYIVMHSWLKNFAFRVDIGIGVFIASALAAFLIALMTLSFQTIKAALKNPVDSLRYE